MLLFEKSIYFKFLSRLAHSLKSRCTHRTKMPKSDIAIDNKLIKKHYPNTNNDQELSFIFESDPNLCLLKNKIAIHMMIELDENYLPDNGFAAKQFSSISVELNSQKISNNKTG